MRELLEVPVSSIFLRCMIWFGLHRFENICRFIITQLLAFRGQHTWEENNRKRFLSFFNRTDLEATIELGTGFSTPSVFIAFTRKGLPRVPRSL